MKGFGRATLFVGRHVKRLKIVNKVFPLKSHPFSLIIPVFCILRTVTAVGWIVYCLNLFPVVCEFIFNI